MTHTLTATDLTELRSFDREALTVTDNYDIICGVKEVPLASLPVGRRFSMVLTCTGRRIEGILVRKGPGTIAVAVDATAKTRTFMSDGEVITIRSTPEIAYWSPTTPVLDLKVQGDVTRWTTEGGTGVIPKPGLATVNTRRATSADYDREDGISDMATATKQVKEKIAQLPIEGEQETATAGNAKEPKAPRVKAEPKPLNPCGDGCGEMVKGRFKQGHDSKFYSMLKKVVAGDMKFEQLPKLMRANLGDLKGVNKALAAHGGAKAK